MRLTALTANVRNLSRMLDHYSHFNPSPLSVKQFIDFGKAENNVFVFIVVPSLYKYYVGVNIIFLDSFAPYL